MSLRRDDKRDTNDNEEEGKKLAPCERPDQCRIGFAEIFHHDSENRVANEEQSGQHAVWLPHARPHKPQNREQHNTLEEGFINLRWMPRRQN